MLEAVLRTAYGRPARMSERAFWRRYGRIEHERLEFKASARNLGESVVAMAMTLGGTILVGVGDDGSVQGCRADQDTLDRVATLADEVQVDLRVSLLAVGRATVLAVAVPAIAPRVVTTPDGRLLRRVGGSNRPLRGDAVLRFLPQSVAENTPAAPLQGLQNAMRRAEAALAAELAQEGSLVFLDGPLSYFDAAAGSVPSSSLQSSRRI